MKGFDWCLERSAKMMCSCGCRGRAKMVLGLVMRVDGSGERG